MACGPDEAFELYGEVSEKQEGGLGMQQWHAACLRGFTLATAGPVTWPSWQEAWSSEVPGAWALGALCPGDFAPWGLTGLPPPSVVPTLFPRPWAE